MLFILFLHLLRFLFYFSGLFLLAFALLGCLVYGSRLNSRIPL